MTQHIPTLEEHVRRMVERGSFRSEASRQRNEGKSQQPDPEAEQERREREEKTDER